MLFSTHSLSIQSLELMLSIYVYAINTINRAIDIVTKFWCQLLIVGVPMYISTLSPWCNKGEFTLSPKLLLGILDEKVMILQ